MAEATVHEWLGPRVRQLVREAGAAGFPRETVVAVLIDLVTSADLDTVLPPTETALPHGPGPQPDAEDDEGMPREIGADMPNLRPRPRP